MRYIVRDKIWLFGMDPQGVDEFLKPYRWRIVEHLGYEDLAARYVNPLAVCSYQCLSSGWSTPRRRCSHPPSAIMT